MTRNRLELTWVGKDQRELIVEAQLNLRLYVGLPLTPALSPSDHRARTHTFGGARELLWAILQGSVSTATLPAQTCAPPQSAPSPRRHRSILPVPPYGERAGVRGKYKQLLRMKPTTKPKP